MIMNFKRSITSIFLLLTVTIFTGCEENDIRLGKALNNFSKSIEKENLDNITLTIYYLSPFILTRAPLSIDNLISHNATQKIVVDSNSLKEHVDLLNQINEDILIRIEYESSIDARLYYVFETKKTARYLMLPCGVAITVYLSMGLSLKKTIFFTMS
jgi:hypothetical protein